MKVWMSVEETSEYVGISKEVIYRLLKSKSIPVHRVGKLWKFNTEELDTWILDGKADSSKKKTTRRV